MKKIPSILLMGAAIYLLFSQELYITTKELISIFIFLPVISLSFEVFLSKEDRMNLKPSFHIFTILVIYFLLTLIDLIGDYTLISPQPSSEGVPPSLVNQIFEAYEDIGILNLIIPLALGGFTYFISRVIGKVSNSNSNSK